jgi:hypothetical protein
MRGFKLISMTAVAASGLIGLVPMSAMAQVNINIGIAPVCPYGYYDVAPFSCAPAGYYGPEWFSGDVFIGAGPWFHGRREFRGQVNNSFHPDHGYRGEFPHRGDRAEPASRPSRSSFRGNEERDGRGHETHTR